MANEVVKKQKTDATVKQATAMQELNSPESAWSKAFAKALPNPAELGRFMACALSQFSHPKTGRALMACSKASIYNAVMQSARLGVMPDGMNAYLIPYGGVCSFQLSYRGLCDMAIRNGIAKYFASDIVCENDTFIWENGELVKHVPNGWDEDERGKVVGVWVRAYLPGGEHTDCRMSVKEVDKVKSKSQSAKQADGPWNEWYDEMAKKSCLKRLFKTMQNTPELAEAVAIDNRDYDTGSTSQRRERVNAADLLAKKQESAIDVEVEMETPSAEPEVAEAKQ